MATQQVRVTFPFSKNSNHLCAVVLHRTRTGLRISRAKMPGGAHSECDAFCFQFDWYNVKTRLVAEIHLCLPFSDHGTVLHESVHAATHRVRLLAFHETKDAWNEETLARNTEYLTNQICTWVRKVKRLLKKKGKL